MNIDAKEQMEELLQRFNKIDRRKLGAIKIKEAITLLREKSNIKVFKTQILDKIIFTNENMVSFDELLAIYYEAELDEDLHKNLMNHKMVEFLKLLQDYRKKCEDASAYIEAQKAHQKIIQIKEKQMKRHKQKLILQQKAKVLSVNSLQQSRIGGFNSAWNDYMSDYEDAAMNSIQKLKARHFREMQKQQQRVKNYFENYLKPSKRILDLKSRQKILVKQKHYMQAERIKEVINRLQAKQKNSKNQQISQRIHKRKQTLQKHQEIALLAHLKRIEKDRNQQMKQRQGDSEKMLNKLKNIQNQIIQKQSIQIRETLGNLRQTMCLTSGQFKKSNKIKSAEKLQSHSIIPSKEPNIKSKTRNQSFKIRVNSFHRTKMDSSLYNP